MDYAVDMYAGERRLMIVSFHKTHLDAVMKITDYIVDDKKNGKDCYSYKVVKY